MVYSPLVRILGTGWGNKVLIHYTDRLKPMAFPLEHAMLAYLRHYTERPPENDRSEMSVREWWESVRDDVLQWIEGLGGDTTSIINARRWVHFPDDVDLGERLAACLYCQGFLRVDGIERKTSVAVSFDQRGLIVTKADLTKAVELARLLPPDLSAQAEPIVVGRGLIAGQRGETATSLPLTVPVPHA